MNLSPWSQPTLLLSVISTLVVALPISANNRQPGVVLNTGNYGGASPLGMTITLASSTQPGIIFVTDSDGLASRFDLDLNPLPPVNGPTICTGLEWDPISDTLWWIGLDSVLYETTLDGEVIGKYPAPNPFGGFVTGLAYDDDADSFWAQDSDADRLFEIDRQGVYTGRSFSVPDAGSAGGFSHTSTKGPGPVDFDILTGPNMITGITRVDDTGGILDFAPNLTGAQLRRNAWHPSGSQGKAVNYVVTDVQDGLIFEVCMEFKPSTVIVEQFPNCGSPTPHMGIGISTGCASCNQEEGGFSGNQMGTTAGNIVLHSGQELREETDLYIKGRDAATDIRIMRRHMTRRNQPNSMFGPAWAFNYRQTLEEQADGTLSARSFGRTDAFRPTSPGSEEWSGGTGRFDRISYSGGSQTFEMRLRGGTRLTFASEGPVGNRNAILTAVTSPNGNQIRFEYESAIIQPDILKRRLLTIIDSFDRPISLQYDTLYPELVRSITDFSGSADGYNGAGRTIQYTYNLDMQLTEVRSPTVTLPGGSGIPNDFPNGKRTSYTYRGHSDPRLQHALTSITFPNQNQFPLALPSRLAWTYVEDLNSPFFGYVQTHRVGAPSGGPMGSGTGVRPALIPVGGTYRYSYESLSQATDVSVPAVRVTVLDRRGTRTEVELNYLGNALKETVFANQGFRPGGPASSYTRYYTYSDDGVLLSEQSPEADIKTLTLASDLLSPGTPVPRGFEGNQGLMSLSPGPRGGDQLFIDTPTVYEPIFNKAFQEVDPRGNYRTTYYLDYMEDLPAACSQFAPQLGITEAELANLFASLGITDLGADVNGDGLRDQFCGNVIFIEHPHVDLPSAATQFLSSTSQDARVYRRFNEYGQLVREEDEEQNVTEYFYYGANDPDGDGNIDNPGADPTTGGYLRRVERDTELAAGRNSGFDPPPVGQTTRYEYQGQPGGFPGNPRGVPTAMIDPRGIRHEFLINELDQAIVEVRATDVSQSTEPGLVAHAYQSVTLYDANNNVVQRRIENRDTLAVPGSVPDFIVHRFRYDLLDQLVAEVKDSGSGQDFLNITTRYGYDANQNLVREIRGFGSTASSETRRTYDERDILVSETRGFGRPEASTVTNEIDNNGNFTAWIDANGADRTEIEYDGYDRQVKVVDRVGNWTEFTFDAASNALTTTDWGPVDGVTVLDGGTAQWLAQTDAFFDERNRRFQVNRHIRHYPGLAVGTIQEGAGSAGPGLVTEITIYDRSSRVVGVLDADADPFETRYDGLNREIVSIDPLGNTVERTYDAASNLTAVKEIETSPLIQSAEEFTTTFVYDALGRRVLVIEPNSQETASEYDSRNNRIRAIDELGNTTEYRHDHLNRLLDTRTYLSANGLGASAINFDITQGGPLTPGYIHKLNSWDELDRVVTRTDDRGNVTRYVYDDLSRKIRCEYQDGTFEIWNYNEDSELVQHRNGNGSLMSYAHDPAGRTTRLDVDNSGASFVVGGTTVKTWNYDGLNRVLQATDNNRPAFSQDDVTWTYVYDSLSRVLREGQGLGPSGTLIVDLEWQGAARQVSETYPAPASNPGSARRTERTYDALDRLTAIHEEGGQLITSFDYVGPWRTLRMQHGNGTVLDKRNEALTQSHLGAGAGYDSNRRHIRHEWKRSNGDQVTAYVNAYNGPAGIGTNRRISELREHLSNSQDSYTFDSAYRMIAFDRGGFPLSTRTLDGVDKMIAFSDEGVDQAPVVDGDPREAGMNQYSSFGGIGRPEQLYDDNGSLRSDGLLQYIFDAFDRLVEVRDRTGATIASYAYASYNRRVLTAALDGGTVERTRFLYKGMQVLEERDVVTNNLLRQYVDGRGLDEHCLLTDLREGSRPGNYYYHCNSQGFTGALSDANAAVVEYYSYSLLGRPRIVAPDGMTKTVSSVAANPYLFQGRRWDSLTEQYYYRNRYFKPEVGEFLTQDPMGNWHHGQGNGYSAFWEDPWNQRDPLGLGKVEIEHSHTWASNSDVIRLAIAIQLEALLNDAPMPSDSESRRRARIELTKGTEI